MLFGMDQNLPRYMVRFRQYHARRENFTGGASGTRLKTS